MVVHTWLNGEIIHSDEEHRYPSRPVDVGMKFETPYGVVKVVRVFKYRGEKHCGVEIEKE